MVTPDSFGDPTSPFDISSTDSWLAVPLAEVAASQIIHMAATAVYGQMTVSDFGTDGFTRQCSFEGTAPFAPDLEAFANKPVLPGKFYGIPLEEEGVVITLLDAITGSGNIIWRSIKLAREDGGSFGVLGLGTEDSEGNPEQWHELLLNTRRGTNIERQLWGTKMNGHVQIPKLVVNEPDSIAFRGYCAGLNFAIVKHTPIATYRPRS